MFSKIFLGYKPFPKAKVGNILVIHASLAGSFIAASVYAAWVSTVREQHKFICIPCICLT